MTNITQISKKEIGDRLRALTLHIAKICEGEPNYSKTILFKTIYHADRTEYIKTGKTITGAKYVHLPNGPAPDGLMELIGQMSTKGEIEEELRPFGIRTQKRIVAKIEPTIPAGITQKQIELINAFAKVLCLGSATKASADTHGRAWQTTVNGEEMPYNTFLLSERNATESTLKWVDEMCAKYGWSGAQG